MFVSVIDVVELVVVVIVFVALRFPDTQTLAPTSAKGYFVSHQNNNNNNIF